MKRKTFKLSEDSVTLPRGTRVVIKTALRGNDGFMHRPGTVATVREVYHNTYRLETPSGRWFQAERDQLTMQRVDLLADLGQRQWDFRRLRDCVMYAAVVGSRAWGLEEGPSDEDVRGWFVAPFDEFVSLWDYPDEVQDPDTDTAYWEIEKLLFQALRADANTLECLWSPLHKHITPLGQQLLDRREAFLSMHILGSFGRYATSQFKKIERALDRSRAIVELLAAIETRQLVDAAQAADFLRRQHVATGTHEATQEVQAVSRSLFDRGLLPQASFAALLQAVAEGRRASLEPPPHRPKNAYNLLRLLHSCLHCLREKEPLMRVHGPLRGTLLAVKKQEIPIEQVLRMARDLATEIDAAAQASPLPERPDFRAADEFLTLCRRQAARQSFAVDIRQPEPWEPSDDTIVAAYHPTLFPVALPPDLEPPALRRFLACYLSDQAAGTQKLALLWLSLSGSHAYGFPSTDSDVDLKAVHTVPARQILGLSPAPKPVDYLGQWEGREYDFTSNELGQVAHLFLAGNGNMLERLLGPFPILITPAGHRLQALAHAALSRRVSHHYLGFFKGMQREYSNEAQRGVRQAKRLLYAYRAALTGVHLLLTGELILDVRLLAERYNFERVPELIRIKQAREAGTIAPVDEPVYLQDFERLDATLHEAIAGSILPQEPPNTAAVEAFVVEQRLLLSHVSQSMEP